MLSQETYRAAYERFRAKLREARLDAHLSQVAVARLLQKPQSFVSKVESGERRVDIIELQAFAGIYRKPLSYFSDESVEQRAHTQG